jgi:hypothetical protein
MEIHRITCRQMSSDEGIPFTALATSSSAKAVETSANTRSAFAIGFICEYASVFIEICSPLICSQPRKLQPN